MRNVMVRCIFSTLSVGFFIIGVFSQDRHSFQWSDQQVLADEWKPFVPGFAPQREYENYPLRAESTRQYFGKHVDNLQNPYKKSYQTVPAANNIEQYAVPPILGSFNTFGLQTIQARNPLLEKNIKDNHQFLDQATHLSPKYYPQPIHQQTQRFPPTFLPPPPQYAPIQHQFLNRLPESSIRQQQQPQRIQTSVQVFPPNPPSHFQSNPYFLGAPHQKPDSYEEEENLSRKQNLQRQNDFLLTTNNVATVYGTRDPNLNIPPPTLKPTPFIRNEQIQDHFLYENPNIKGFGGSSAYHKRPYTGDSSKKVYPDENPSKQVYEQLSQFGRPFTLSKDISKVEQPNHDIDLSSIPYKKEKTKAHTYSYKSNYGQLYPSEASTQANVFLDYEPGKLQSIKSVTYVPQKEMVAFKEEDVSNGPKPFTMYTKSPFLPTPTESDEGLGTFNSDYFQKYTTPAQKLSTLPKNHKYSSMQPGNTRARYPSQQYEPELTVQTEEKIKYPTTTQTTDYESEHSYETTTRKSNGRRRKPSKTKTKEHGGTRTRVSNAHTENAITNNNKNNENYYLSSDISTSEQPSTTQYTVKRTHKTTTYTPEEEYPNYPPQYIKQQENYPKEYFQSQYTGNTEISNGNSNTDYQFNSEKENYPTATQTVFSTTSTPAFEATTSSLKARIKNKYAAVNTTRPRFSIKDYKRTTTPGTLTAAASSTTERVENSPEHEIKTVRKNYLASRAKNKTESTTKDKEESVSETTRKYKPRMRPPSKYRTTSTTAEPDTTTERVNTFKPSTANRYKSSTSKYYNRFRTTTEITSNDAEDSAPASSDKKPVRTMLFSAKRTSTLKPKVTTSKTDVEDEDTTDEPEYASSPLRKNTIGYYKLHSKLEKADDVSQTDLMSSAEEESEKKEPPKQQPQPTPVSKSVPEPQSLEITASGSAATSSEEEMDDMSEMADLRENEVTTPTETATADDRMDESDKVSKVSSLTSIDETDIPISFYQKWTSSNDNQNQ